MKIVVCVKQVPDSAAKLSVDGGQVSWGDASLILNPWDEYAVEAALLVGGDVTLLTMGHEEQGSNEALKQSSHLIEDARFMRNVISVGVGVVLCTGSAFWSRMITKFCGLGRAEAGSSAT